MASPYDLIIRNVHVYDGTGASPKQADVAVTGDRIAAVGTVESAAAGGEIDARGLALAPGFVDAHTHDEFALLLHPSMHFKTLQGVTTCVIGNCGYGVAPYHVATHMPGGLHLDARLPEWDGYGGYFARLESDPAAVNAAVLVGHGTARVAAMGDARRPPTSSELDAMRNSVRKGIEAGAGGLSTGLIYEPGRYAETEEIVELAREVAGVRGLYATHLRNEGTGLLEAVEEAISIGERVGVPVQIAHHKANGREAWGLVEQSLDLIEQARERGVDVTADQYPYTAGSTSLAAVVQNGAFDSDGGPGFGRLDPHDVQLCSCPSSPEYEGLRLDEVMQRLGVSARGAADRLIEVDGRAVIVALHAMHEPDVRRVLAHPTTMIGSDGIPALKGKPHPRLYGTFPRVLGHYARDEGVLSLAEAIHRMTGFPATKFRLVDRGVVRAGAFADLVLFDPATIQDRATFDDPHQPPEGINHVFVNGTAVVRDGEPTGARPGRPLRREG